MKVNRTPAWVWHLQTCYTLLWLAAPAYMASTRAATRVGVVLVWYHHVGLIAFSLIFAWVVLILFGLLLAGYGWMMGRLVWSVWRLRRGRPPCRSRPE